MKIVLKDDMEFKIDRLQANLKAEPGKNAFDDFIIKEEELSLKTPEEIAASFTDENVSEVKFINNAGKEILRKYTNVASIRYIFGDSTELLDVFLSAHGESGGEIVEI